MLDLRQAIQDQALTQLRFFADRLHFGPQDIRRTGGCTSCQAREYRRTYHGSAADASGVCYSYRQGYRSERIYSLVFLSGLSLRQTDQGCS